MYLPKCFFLVKICSTHAVDAVEKDIKLDEGSKKISWEWECWRKIILWEKNDIIFDLDPFLNISSIRENRLILNFHVYLNLKTVLVFLWVLTMSIMKWFCGEKTKLYQLHFKESSWNTICVQKVDCYVVKFFYVFLPSQYIVTEYYSSYSLLPTIKFFFE